MKRFFLRVAAGMLLLGVQCTGWAWDYEMHRVVNQLALATLPPEFPAWVRTPEAQERIAYLAGEPDRWRNTPDLPLRHVNGPDHFFDLEDLTALHMDVANLSHFRSEFTVQYAQARAQYSTNFPPIDASRNTDKTRELCGFLPWTITEQYAKLKSQFSCLREFDALGTPSEVDNARQNALYIMGVMGHYVGDATQPLHTTKHYNGWIGENPNQFTTRTTFHSWIDGGYMAKVGIDKDALIHRIQPAKPLRAGPPGKGSDDVFAEAIALVVAGNKEVEHIYQMEKEGQFSGEGETGLKGRAYLSERLVQAGQMLGQLWLTAWQQAPPDKFLKEQLAKRQAKAAAPASSNP